MANHLLVCVVSVDMRDLSSIRGDATACGRARLWAALAVDGVLSEFEQRALESHVRICPDCRVYAETIVGFTRTIRTTPLAQPGPWRSDAARARAVRRPRRRIQRSLEAVVTSAVAASIGVAFLLGRASTEHRISTIQPPRVAVAGPVAQDDTVGDVQALRDFATRRAAEQASEPRRGRPGVQAD